MDVVVEGFLDRSPRRRGREEILLTNQYSIKLLHVLAKYFLAQDLPPQGRWLSKKRCSLSDGGSVGIDRGPMLQQGIEPAARTRGYVTLTDGNQLEPEPMLP
ncbi:hypothetical protein AVEN_57604-1 [Araneus ventricosus]|uniref:Uncharacterized protein n=1 Tax=Araneus ventricosus TaxID=182803 RepID=A0A4Y2WRT4_ARAVE|nr:hypothetical protein AVEN_57604-1 [Araneus ventricosus]